VVADLTKAGATFDTLAVRNKLRAVVGPDVSVNYGDVHPELFHYYRKGGFGPLYLTRLKKVTLPADNAMTAEEGYVIEYVPETGTVLKKVLERWHPGK
jgi:hypothetical protein